MASIGNQKQPKTLAEAEKGDWFSRVIDGKIVEGRIDLIWQGKRDGFFGRIRDKNDLPIGISGPGDDPLTEEISPNRRRVLEYRALKKGKATSSGLSKADRDSAKLTGPHVQGEFRK